MASGFASSIETGAALSGPRDRGEYDSAGELAARIPSLGGV